MSRRLVRFQRYELGGDQTGIEPIARGPVGRGVRNPYFRAGVAKGSVEAGGTEPFRSLRFFAKAAAIREGTAWERAMPLLEMGKKIVELATGWQRPSSSELDGLLHQRKPKEFRFKDDGVIPNHPHWPLIVYQGAVRLAEAFDPAAVFEELFARNGWGNSWRNGIYDYVHYHSRIHEVLGCARGRAKVRFGGNRGRSLSLKAGDVAILPAGTGHRCLGATENFLVVGAYPPNGTYDECTRSEDHARAVETIPKVTRPRKDPVYGAQGPLTTLWKPVR